MDERTYTITVTLPAHEAWALTELCKRIGFGDCRSNAIDDSEAYNMLYAMEHVRQALAQQGVVTR